ncbi:MAG: tetratricopeptide repeat protein [Dehalococcoidia bacterium]|nr:tetratricopeptide repeat protein [Dehalococcoidia bacterium]
MRPGELLFRGELALRLGHPQYAAAAARRVLEELPGHLKAHLLLGQALLDRDILDEASEEFRKVLDLDPENVVARSAHAVALEGEGKLKGAISEMEVAWESDPYNPDLREALTTLRAKLERVDPGPELSAAGLGRLYARKGQHAKALGALRETVAAGPPRSDILLTQAESLWRMDRLEEAARVCQSVLSQFPNAVKARLLLGLIRVKRGDIAGGTALLHEASSADPSGAVATAFLEGTGFEIPRLEDTIDLDPPATPLPQEVEAAIASGVSAKGMADLDERQLPDIQIEIAPNPAAQELQEALYDLSDRMVVRGADKAGPEPHLGLYHLVTSRLSLTEKYGERGYAAVERKLKALHEALTQSGYDAHILLLEESKDPQVALEMMQQQIHQAEASSGVEAMGHVLLVGGDEILPFHRLSNPTEDDDALVLSDAPYASGQHIFVSRRAVGRIPDSSSGDPRFIISLLDGMISSHLKPAPKGGHGPSLLGFMPQSKGPKAKTFGYSALVWKDATDALYELIGDSRSVQACPPITERSFEAGWIDRSQFVLFNLHGTEDGASWYGQKDSSYPMDFPLFPVALNPANIAKADLTGAIIFTEACYGANIVGKSAEESLALSFLRRGAACVVGSTRLAYGTSEPPLIAADLLARYFWLCLEQGMTAGESLARARTRLIQEAQSRQGYVDGDDQKTALEFILLGDPAARVLSLKKRAGVQESMLDTSPSQPQLYCKRRSSEGGAVRVEGEFMARARNYLKRVAPDAWDTQLSVLPRHCCVSGRFFECQGECHNEKTIPTGPYFVTARKSISTQDGWMLHRVARITVDDDGRLLKACVSK